MSDLQAALGLAQLAKLDRMTEVRRRHEGLYRQALEDCPLVLPPPEDEGHRRALHLFIVRIDAARTSWTREALIEALNEQGIFPSVHFIPVHLHPYYRDMGYRRGMYPNAESCFDGALSLPFYPAMPDGSVTRLLDTVRALLRQKAPSVSHAASARGD
jgi:dTDP-4-amino-4,6-dideoxygalactose transaminase